MNKPKPIYIRTKDRLVDFPIAEEIMIEEFEKVKLELSNSSYYNHISGKKQKLVSWEDIERIFNKHISELKEK